MALEHCSIKALEEIKVENLKKEGLFDATKTN